jgi:hypothetical protein|tara:strand:- start:2144 stop:2893 length:750 start_codon:yes stop_codon:yes gene_type:complete
MTKLIKITGFVIGLALGYSSLAIANEIYIEQIGDNLDLDITQDGQNNEFGDSTTDALLDGDDMTFAITQTGNTNTIDAKIKGDDYTGTWQFTGNTNNVDLTCDNTSGVNCQTVTVNITTTGSTNIFDVFVGETADAQNLVANFTVTGDGNVVQTEVDGEDAVVTVILNNSSSNNSTTLNDQNSGNSTQAGGNLVDIDIAGDGDTNGHKVILDVTGGGNKILIDQSGIYDNTVNLDMTGDAGDVNITQSD